MEREPQFEGKEQGPLVKPSIRLEFLRHDKPLPKSPGQSADKMPLAPESRGHAEEIGKTKNPDPTRAVAFGSPRVRSQETALRQLLANEDWVTEETSLEEIEQGISDRMPVGGKLLVSEKLNYRSDANPDYAKVYQSHYAGAKDLVPFLFNESDDLTVRLGDTEDFSYTRLAANVAELIKKYVGILPRWEQLAEEKPETYGENPELQRFLGTHSTISESFLLKVIEKTQGRGAAQDFVNALPDKNGIGFSDGISAVVDEFDGATKISITFHAQHWEIDENVLDEIISDRDQLDAAARKNKKV